MIKFFFFAKEQTGRTSVPFFFPLVMLIYELILAKPQAIFIHILMFYLLK